MSQETITATATDGSGATDTIVITITITGANDAPTSSTGSGSTDEDTLVTFATSDFSFTDVDDVDTAWTQTPHHYSGEYWRLGMLQCKWSRGSMGRLCS
ncbi:MAG: VCBS domain-containing protein [Candidatus Thalassarchaeaceae archaeon]